MRDALKWRKPPKTRSYPPLVGPFVPDGGEVSSILHSPSQHQLPQNHLPRTLPLRETPPGFHHILRVEHECTLTTTHRENSRGGRDVYLVYTSAFLYFTSCSSPMLQP